MTDGSPRFLARAHRPERDSKSPPLNGLLREIDVVPRPRRFVCKNNFNVRAVAVLVEDPLVQRDHPIHRGGAVHFNGDAIKRRHRNVAFGDRVIGKRGAGDVYLRNGRKAAAVDVKDEAENDFLAVRVVLRRARNEHIEPVKRVDVFLRLDARPRRQKLKAFDAGRVRCVVDRVDRAEDVLGFPGEHEVLGPHIVARVPILPGVRDRRRRHRHRGAVAAVPAHRVHRFRAVVVRRDRSPAAVDVLSRRVAENAQPRRRHRPRPGGTRGALNGVRGDRVRACARAVQRHGDRVEGGRGRGAELRHARPVHPALDQNLHVNRPPRSP